MSLPDVFVCAWALGPYMPAPGPYMPVDPIAQSSEGSSLPMRRSGRKSIHNNDDDVGSNKNTRGRARDSITTATSSRASTFLPSRGPKRVKSGLAESTTTSKGSHPSRIKSTISDAISRRWCGKSELFARMVIHDTVFFSLFDNA